MIEQIISLVATFWRHLLPTYVVAEYEMGVKLRLGKYKVTVGPGLHWKIPFVDELMVDSVVTDTWNLPSQALTTSDNKEIIVSAVVRFHVDDMRKFKLTITDEESAMGDICLGVVRSAVTSRTWVECQDKKIDTVITNQVRAEVEVYGIRVEKVRLTDLTRVRSFRLFTDSGSIL